MSSTEKGERSFLAGGGSARRCRAEAKYRIDSPGFTFRGPVSGNHPYPGKVAGWPDDKKEVAIGGIS